MSETKIISYKKTKIDKDSKGRDKFVVYLTQEEAQKFAEALQEVIGNERGIKLSFHTEMKDVPWSRQQEPSTFGFINAVEAPGQGFRGQAPGQGKGKFVPKAPAKPQGMSPEVRARAAATLKTEVE